MVDGVRKSEVYIDRDDQSMIFDCGSEVRVNCTWNKIDQDGKSWILGASGDLWMISQNFSYLSREVTAK